MKRTLFSEGTCLIVEDNPGDAELINEMLLRAGWTAKNVERVDTLGRALARLDAPGVRTVLLDLRLPDCDGVEGVQQLLAKANELPIVVLTGHADQELALSCLAAGAQDYLSKQELKPEQLRRALGYAFARTRELAERGRADALQKHLAAIVETTSDGIISTRVDGTITSWNEGAARIFGVPAAEALGRPASEIIRAPTAEQALAQAQRMRDVGRGLGSREPEEMVRLRRDGQAVTLSVASSPLHDEHGAIVGMAAICRDITEGKRRDQELHANHRELLKRDAQLRALLQRINAVREDERKRISREVHDELGQLLTGLKMNVRWVEKQLAAWSAPAPQGPVIERLHEIQKLADSTIESVQRIALELRPSALDSLGLAPAMRDEARRFESRSGVETELRIRTSSQPGPEISTGFFRIFQELLTNVTRHAHASRVQVDLEDSDGMWTLRLEDDGVGISEQCLSLDTSLGLLGMRERARALGGEFKLERHQEKGTVAVVRVPS